jgi:hypothetical protein
MTKQEIFGPGRWASSFPEETSVYSKRYALEKADEYAEKYAKALLIYIRKEEIIIPESLIDHWIKLFKESLKK